jgi:hypothetical protein
MAALPGLFDGDRALDLKDLLQPGPRRKVDQSGTGGQTAGFDATVPQVVRGGLGEGVSDDLRLLKQGANSFAEMGLVLFGDQDVVPTRIQHVLGQGALRMEGIGRDDTPVEHETFEQPVDRGQFIGLIRHRTLGERQPESLTDGSQEMCPRRTAFLTAMQGLAIRGERLGRTWRLRRQHLLSPPPPRRTKVRTFDKVFDQAYNGVRHGITSSHGSA